MYQNSTKKSTKNLEFYKKSTRILRKKKTPKKQNSTKDLLEFYEKIYNKSTKKNLLEFYKKLTRILQENQHKIYQNSTRKSTKKSKKMEHFENGMGAPSTKNLLEFHERINKKSNKSINKNQ